MPENSTHKYTNAVNNVQPIRNASHMGKILSVYNRLQAGDYENGNGGKRRVSRLTQFTRNASIGDAILPETGMKLTKKRGSKFGAVVAPSDTTEKNSNIGAQLRSILHTMAQKRFRKIYFL